MPVTVLLSEVIEALMFQTDTSRAFVNRQTGEVLACTEEEIHAAERDDDQTAPPWMQPELPKIRDAVRGEPWLPLPSKFEIHEWEIMLRFTDEQANEEVGQELRAAIHGAGAFRCFREALSHLGIERLWYNFRDRQFENTAREWLIENGFDFRWYLAGQAWVRPHQPVRCTTLALQEPRIKTKPHYDSRFPMANRKSKGPHPPSSSLGRTNSYRIAAKMPLNGAISLTKSFASCLRSPCHGSALPTAPQAHTGDAFNCRFLLSLTAPL